MKKNWIKETIEFIRNAMNEGLKIDHFFEPENSIIKFTVYRTTLKVDSYIHITITKDNFSIASERGYFITDINLSEREFLELQNLGLSVKEYKEDIALSDFDNFFKKEEEKPTTIDDLDE